ncbi:hypothetical protein DRE_00086 [Drechslerella stenobrocha 248]|uniref:CENP-V/GFA domain-containing protein n=1 Tax=Drechslerella stenobrocha 248 TaxID=1043628 RepID=W7HX64_9PEZI|nr:hypothetical protein DRE_00086 [Drechslerella stenobrocha 248]
MDTASVPSKDRASIPDERKQGECLHKIESECKLQPIIIDGGCLCSLIRYRITIPVDFQQTELYDKVVGFAHCYCHSCRVSVSSLAKTKLKLPRDMVEWTSRASLIEDQKSRNSTKLESPSSSNFKVSATLKSQGQTQPLSTAPTAAAASGSRYQYKRPLTAARLHTTLEAIQQDLLAEEDPIGTDSEFGCCCRDDDVVLSTPAEATEKQPNPAKPVWGGTSGFHKRIWKRDRGVGGKASPISTSTTETSSPRSTTPNQSTLLQPHSKAPTVIPPEDEKKAQPPVTTLDILRWEARLLQQQCSLSSDSNSDCSSTSSNDDNDDDDGDDDDNISLPHHKSLRIPWPFKEYTHTARDGRTSYHGFCSYCGGGLSSRTSVSIHDMVDVLVGSMDDPGRAMRDIGFLAEFHCVLAGGGVEEGARLGMQVGSARDAAAVGIWGCDFAKEVDCSDGGVDDDGMTVEDDELVDCEELWL